MKDEKFEKLLGHPRVKKDAMKNKDGIDSEEGQNDKKKNQKTSGIHDEQNESL